MVNPITTDKLRVLGIIGHSNGDSLAGINEMWALAPHLLPRNYPFLSPQNQFWENIYVATSAFGWPGPSGTPPTHTIDEVAWLELTTNNPVSPAYPHPHPSPYSYPNNQGAPWPNYLFQAELLQPGIDRGTGTRAGIEVPLLYSLSSYWSDQIGLVKMSIPSSQFLRYDQGFSSIAQWSNTALTPTQDYYESQVDASFGYFNWFTPTECFDWAPSTGRFYKRFFDKCIAAKAALPTGTTMSMDNVVCWFGDNDCTKNELRVANWEGHVRAWIKKFRQDLSDNNLSTLPPDQIHIIWMGVHPDYNFEVEGQNEVMNAAVARVAADDPHMSYIPIDDYEMCPGDDGHYGPQGYLDAAQDIFDAIVDHDIAPYDAMDVDELLTVSQLKERIRLHYSRGNTQTDIKDAVLLAHMNGAMHHIVHQCGDMAYWLRRRVDLNIEGGATMQPVTLPKYVHRLLGIEDPADATYPLRYEMVGHTAGGKLQVVFNETVNGTYTVHFIRLPRDLLKDEEKVPIPVNLLEWMVTECCLRLARAASNPLHTASWQAEVMRLQGDVLKNLSQTYRAKRDRLHSVRRLPDVLHRRRW